MGVRAVADVYGVCRLMRCITMRRINGGQGLRRGMIPSADLRRAWRVPVMRIRNRCLDPKQDEAERECAGSEATDDRVSHGMIS